MRKTLLFAFAIITALNLSAQTFSDDFQDQDASDWTTYTPTYEAQKYKWAVRDYGGNYYLSAAAFDGSVHATEQWIVSPAFDASGMNTISVTFDNRMRYAPTNPLEVFVSTDFAGDSASFADATWVPIEGYELDASANDYDWLEGTTGTATITGTATTYIAFKYTSTDEIGGNWVVDNISVNATVAVDEIENELRIFPNPAKTEINVRSNTIINSISISNLIGQNVLNFENINTSNYKINLHALRSGVYFAKIDNIDGTHNIVKFVKK